jgi:hypothetical protein
MRLTLFVSLWCALAHAQLEDEPVPNATASEPSVPDASLRAVAGQLVTLRLRGGQELAGRLLAIDPVTVTLARLPSQTVVTVAKSELTELRLLPQAPVVVPTPAVPVAEVASAPARERHFGLHLGLAPALDLDVDYKLFYGFANVSLIFPAATDGNWVSFSFGAGLNVPMTKRTAWKLELFTYVTPLRFDGDWWVGFGAGLGVHYTFRSGIALGLKIPVIGYSFTTKSTVQSGEAIGYFYLASATGLPLFSLGYRF